METVIGGVVLLMAVVMVVVLLVVMKIARSLPAAEGTTARFEAVNEGIDRLARGLREEMAANRREGSAASFDGRRETTEALDRIREAVERKLSELQADNSSKLEQMRATVDEKLQSTLETRLGAQFELVSKHLTEVARGLGEMQSLAAGVGDLKKVMVNVKVRGGWGEVQLKALLDEILSPNQFVENVKTKEEGSERVEFAIRLPGRGEGEGDAVLLPIDAKFPVEDYLRLAEAQERADLSAVEEASKALENRVKACAKEISAKHLNPPITTDFAILYLPTEGLYAEVVRRPGLVEGLQRDHRVVVAGPTTFAALLNSLQMGFRTLAIQKRSSEVWNLLGAVKTEFGKFGTVLEGVKKKLDEASNKMDDAAKRTRAIERKLRGVQELPGEVAAGMLPATPDDSSADGSDDEPA